MRLPTNAFKHALRNGKPQLGLWVAMGNSVGAELCAAAGFDFLVIDAEHGVNDVTTVLPQLQAIAAYPTQPVVRLPQGEAALIKRYLDIGAQTLLVPMVDTAEQASALVRAMRYAPAGMRGMATMTRAARWSRVTDYVARAHEELCLIPQIETVTALGNLDAIAAVEGVDALFIGPVDLSASMGFAGQPGHPDVVRAVEDGIKRTRAAGKAVGILTLDEQLARRYQELGCAFVAVGVDLVLYSKAVDALRARFVGAPGGSAPGGTSSGGGY